MIDSAVYIPAVGPRADFIAGAQGGRLIKFDATSGIKLSSSLIVPTMYRYGSIGYCSTNDTIYMCAGGRMDLNIFLAAFDGGNDVFSVNPTTLAAIGTTAWADIVGGGKHLYHPDSTTRASSGIGPSRILIVGEWAYMVCDDLNSIAAIKITDTTAWWNYNQNGVNGPMRAFDLAYDSTNSTLWTTISGADSGVPGNGHLNSYATLPFTPAGPSHNFATAGGTYTEFDCSTQPTFPYGVAYCPDNNCVYLSTYNQTTPGLKKMTVAGSVFSSIAMGRPNAIPLCVRYNSATHKIYVATLSDNTVIVVDPLAGDAVTVKTGFDNVVDFVFTPTKSFAVQHSGTGLKEIT